jgi:chromosome segregation ATPase
MIKKITTSLLIMIFLLGMGTLAYAGTGTGNSATNKATALEQKKEALQQKIQNRQILKEDIQPLLDQIKANRVKTLQLQAEAAQARAAATQHIKDLKANPDNLTDAQIAALNQAKESLKQSRTDLSDTKGEIKNEMATMKTARKAQNEEQVKTSLNNIIAVQEKRMELIQNCITEMKQIQAI